MNVVKYKEYAEDLTRFINKHSIRSECKSIQTSPFINGGYSKEYLYEDGASFWEYNRVIDATAVASVKGITFPVSVKLIEHEYWSTDNAGSKYWYEKA